MRFNQDFLAALAILFGVVVPVLGDGVAPAKPNVLFIVVDDLRPELGCYGKDYIKSPNIDGLARTGMVFDRAYCQQAVCSPTRSSLMTGTRPDTTKVWDLVTHFRTALPDVVTLQQNFKNHGYFVQGMGKIFHGGFNDPQSWSVPWQNPKAVTYALPENEALSSVKMAGEPDGEKGDNTGAALGSYSLPGNPPASSKEATNDPIEQQPKLKKGAVAIATSDAVAGDVQVSRHNSRGPAYECADVPDNTYTDGKVADLAVKTLREISKKPEPFFLAVGFIKPHLPFVAPKKYWDLYDPAKIELAPNPFRPIGAPDYAILPGGELRLYHDIPEEHLPDDLARKLKHGYYAGVSYSDAQIGRVLAELDRLNLRTNTIIILWGDHGWKLGEHDAWCKHTDVENDVNAPLILSVPGMKNAGAHSKALVEFVDVYPTLSELTGLPLPSHLEGTSFKPLLDDPNRAWKSAVFSQYPRTQKGGLMGYTMGTDRYRFTVWVSRKDHAKIDATELYDHLNDPQENTNIVNHADQAIIAEQLMAQWKKGWQGAKPLTKN